METASVLTPHETKALEYLVAILYLALFVPFWRYLDLPALPARAWAPRPATSWFHLPEGLSYHPGHAWVAAGDGVATLGWNDFARRLVGVPQAIELPATGTLLHQGDPGWTIDAGDARLDMLAPIGGVVLERNEEVLRDPSLAAEDPYGKGWLLKVRLDGDGFRQLLDGNPARRWMEAVAEGLLPRGELGLVMQDGGEPVSGLGRELWGESWAEQARAHFRS